MDIFPIIPHDLLPGFVANEHIDHSGVSVIAGILLTGGGDLTADRTLNVDEASIDHDALANFIANEHIDWTNASDNFLTTGSGGFGSGGIILTDIYESDKPQTIIAARRTHAGSSSRTLTLVSDTDTKLRIYDNATVLLDDWFNQNVKQTASPTFAGLTVDTNVLVVDAANNRVGIGTASPQQLLHLFADNATMNEAIRLQNTGSSVGDEIGIYFRHYTDGRLQAFIKDELISGWPTKLHFGTAAGVNNAATKMTIDGSGNVGINTTSPSQKLDIVAGNGGVLISDTGGGIGGAKSLYFGRGGGTWMPIVWGVGGTSSDAGLHLLGETEEGYDSGNAPLIRLNARQSDSTPITTRPLLAIENNGSQLVTVDKDGNVNITGTVTGTSFITAGNIGVVADTDLLQLAANTLIVNGTITLPLANKINFRDTDISIGSAFDGKLDISADISVGFFYDNADVGNENDGQSVYINRMAAEGDDYLQFYINSDRYAIINANQTLKIQRQGSTLLLLAANALTVNGTLGAGVITGTSFITGGDIGIAADTDLLQLAANALTINGAVHISQYLYHLGDVDTGIIFANDQFFFQAGGIDMMRFVEGFISDYVVVNEGGADVDFRVEAVGQTNALFVQGSDGAVSIATTLDVVGDFTAGTIQADNGFTGSWVNNEGDTVTVVGGIITSIAA